METKETISIIIPTMGNRPDGLKRSLDSVKILDYPPELIDVHVIIDNPRKGLPLRLKEGVEKSSGTWIVFASDDTEFTPDTIKEALNAHKETGKRLIAFNDGPVIPDKGNICTHFIVKRDLLPLIGGEIFCTKLNHCGVDNLLYLRAKKINEFMRCEKALFNHYHFSTGKAVIDDTYRAAWGKVHEDRAILAKIMEEEGLVWD